MSQKVEELRIGRLSFKSVRTSVLPGYRSKTCCGFFFLKKDQYLCFEKQKELMHAICMINLADILPPSIS